MTTLTQEMLDAFAVRGLSRAQIQHELGCTRSQLDYAMSKLRRKVSLPAKGCATGHAAKHTYTDLAGVLRCRECDKRRTLARKMAAKQKSTEASNLLAEMDRKIDQECRPRYLRDPVPYDPRDVVRR